MAIVKSKRNTKRNTKITKKLNINTNNNSNNKSNNSGKEQKNNEYKKTKKNNLLISFLNKNMESLNNGVILKNEVLDNVIFNPSSTLSCICENLFKEHLNYKCNCNSMKTYSSQGMSGASIHSILCKFNKSENKHILKVMPIDTYYIKLRVETKNYIFIELDDFSIQTLINTYVYNELPNNSVNIVKSGICTKKSLVKKSLNKKYFGYNLMTEANLGDGEKFINNIIDGTYDNIFKIDNEDNESLRYKLVSNFLLQSILIIGHLQSSYLEFCHNDYKPMNVFVTHCDPKKLSYFKFRVFGKTIKVKNLGFAVLIADFDRSSISLNKTINNKKNQNNKKFRIIPSIKFKPLLTSYVNYIINKYGDIDPDKVNDKIKLDKFFITNLIPKSRDPTLTILRSAGVKLFRDIDLYTFFIKLIDTSKVKNYITKTKLNTTLMNFMSNKFRENLFALSLNNITLNESAHILIKILNTIDEPMNTIFTNDYITSLNEFTKHF